MTTRRKRRKQSGFFKRAAQALRAKWKLVDERDHAEFRLTLQEQKIEDLEERLEAYKDALTALNRSHRLEGMVYEKQLAKIIESKSKL